MKLKIGSKLGLSFAAVLALMLLSGGLTYMRLREIKQVVDYTVQVRVPGIENARILQNDMNFAAAKARQTILAGTDPTRRAAAQQAYDNAWLDINKDVETLTAMAPRWALQQNRDRLTSITEQLPKIREAQQATMNAAATGGRDAVILAGNTYADRVTPVVNAATKSLGDMAQSFDELMQQEKKKIEAADTSAVWTLGITVTLALAIGVVLALMISRQISRATNSVLHQAEAIAAGNLSGDELKITSKDELGELGGAINRMHASLRKVIQSISENSQNVANASEEFSSVSQQISANSEETSAQANAVSNATEEVNRNLHTVATATEEMSASISEIAKNATEAAKVAAEAMRTANETNAIVGKLGASSAEIGQVIKTITSIAQKTDLLALNATVEAARAGEVGAGFAVVANEVKELAKQTAAATEDISRKIEAIQVDTKGAVQAITTITGVITRVNEISGTIAAAVEEQSATTNEMSRNLTDAAKGATQVTENIGGVAQAAQNTSHGATDSLKAAQQLAQLSHKLRQLVEQFKLEKYPGESSRRSYSSPSNRQGTTVEAEQREEVLTR
ncbi:MAG TPA: methyl-accepting chemotaxis protein [Candidatus Acidoferrum sp.]|nr:methyl-accepting chemotaxis protein [Candidatus Acidoferrum sp.]